MSKRKAKKKADARSDDLPPRLPQTLGPGAALILGPDSPEAYADDSEFWGQTILNQYRRVALSPPDPDTSARVSVFRALNRMKRFCRFRALCEAVGLGPGEGIGEADAADWWLRILLMPQKFHDVLWRLFPKYLGSLRKALAEAATTTARRKEAIIVSQAEQIADLRKEVKAPAARKRLVKRFPPGKRSKAWQELRRIVQSAKKHVWIEDAWLGSDVVHLLGADLLDGVQLRVLGPEDGNRFWNGALASLKMLCNDLPSRIAVRVTTDLHDRYVYVDNHVWRFSESPKDMGAKRTAKIIDEGERSAGLVADFEKRWSSARQVYPP
jgi:hypothetical protein